MLSSDVNAYCARIYTGSPGKGGTRAKKVSGRGIAPDNKGLEDAVENAGRGPEFQDLHD